MLINLIVDGTELTNEALEVMGIPRAGDYVRTSSTVNGQYIVLFVGYQIGKESVNIHVAPTSESELDYAYRLNPPPTL